MTAASLDEAERVVLEERIAFAELARDNALALRDDVQARAKEKCRKAGEEIAKMRQERNQARDVARQLRSALADLTEPHSSWCMGHEGGVQTTADGSRVGIGKLVVVECRCSPALKAARAALEAAASLLGAT